MKFDQLSKVTNTQIYIDAMRPLFNMHALFSDGTAQYRSPSEPKANEEVVIRFRTAKENVEYVNLVVDETVIPMKKASTNDLFDYYEAVIQLGETDVHYYFQIVSGRITCYYNRKCATTELFPNFNFVINPGFSTPNWAKGAVFYQIFVDRFYNGDSSNDVLDNEYCYIGEKTTRVTEWEKYPNASGIREFYGGDLLGVIKKLDYLQDLGIEAIYLNPIFVSPSNHKYDIQDYDYVDPHFGAIVSDEGHTLSFDDNDNTNATRYIHRVTNKQNLEASNQVFIQLVEEAHRRGIKVILDGVFNHCGSFNKWLDKERIYEQEEDYEKGAYVDENSPYRSFFRFRENGWPYNGKYEGWWGHDTLPKLNYEESPMLVEYIMRIARKWVSPPYNADGWRLDVAADLGRSQEYNHKFWREFRKNVKEANPNAIILAEHYGNPGSWLKGNEWDTVMNYDAFMEPVTWFLTGMEKHSDEFRGDQLGHANNFYMAMQNHMASFNTQSLFTAMNELSNHDHSRFLTRTNHSVGRTNYSGPWAASDNINKGIFREGVVMQMTWPGAPTIYYGDEAGVCGWTDPDNRRTYPWGNEDHDLIAFHKDIIRIHKDYPVLRYGSIKYLTGHSGFISYGRFDEKDKMMVAINNNRIPIHVSIPVCDIGVSDSEQMVRLIETSVNGHKLDALILPVVGGKLSIHIDPYSAVVFKNLR